MKAIKKAIGYVRVSSNGQRNGDGLERQRQSIENYCQLNNIELINIIADKGVSGTLLNRPGLNSIFNQKIDCIIIEGLDRLGRDLMVSETIIARFKDKGFELLSTKEGKELLDNNPSRVMIRQIVSSVAQYDKSQIVSRLKVARDRKRATGIKVEGRKSIKETSLETYKEIKRLRRKKKGMKQLSYKVISSMLNDNGYQTSTGKSFTGENVRRILNTSYK